MPPVCGGHPLLQRALDNWKGVLRNGVEGGAAQAPPFGAGERAGLVKGVVGDGVWRGGAGGAGKGGARAEGCDEDLGGDAEAIEADDVEEVVGDVGEELRGVWEVGRRGGREEGEEGALGDGQGVARDGVEGGAAEAAAGRAGERIGLVEGAVRHGRGVDVGARAEGGNEDGGGERIDVEGEGVEDVVGVVGEEERVRARRIGIGVHGGWRGAGRRDS